MQKSIKVYAEQIFVALMLFHFINYGADALMYDNLNWYGINFEAVQNIVDTCFLLIIWGFSEKWSFLSKRCLATMILLSLLNVIDSIIELKNYYFFYMTILTINLIYTLIYLLKWKKS